MKKKMRKFGVMTLLVGAVLLAGFASCADNTIPGDEQGKNAMTADVQVRISVDNGSQTRAANDETGDGNETGIADEYLVKNATLYFFSDATGFVKSETFTGFVQDPTVTANQVVWTSQNRKMAEGSYKVVVLVNGTAATAPAVGSTIANFMKDVKTGADTWIASASNGLLMASRNTSTDPVSPVSITAANTPANPAVVEAHVERTVAKVTLAGKAGYTYSGAPLPAGVSIQLTDYRVLNLRNEFFTFRHTTTGFTPVNPGVTVDNVTYGFGDLPDANSYIMDPKTFMKNTSLPTGLISGVDYRDWYAHTAFSTAIGNGTTETILGYSQENTMEKEAQKKGYGTAIVFKAQITGAGTVGAGENLYYDRKNKIFYNTYAALQAVFTTLHPTTPNYMELAAHDISAYKDGKTTYVYYIKHADNTTENNMGIMEYAMVRNNVYKINVTDITAPGRGLVPDPSDPTGSTPLDPANPTVPDGGDPTIDPAEDIETEEIDIALKVQLTVRPWIIRNNNVILK